MMLHFLNDWGWGEPSIGSSNFVYKISRKFIREKVRSSKMIKNDKKISISFFQSILTHFYCMQPIYSIHIYEMD